MSSPSRSNRSLVTKILRYPIHRSASAVITVYDMGRPGVLPAISTVTVLSAKGAVVRTVTKNAAPKLGRSAALFHR